MSRRSARMKAKAVGEDTAVDSIPAGSPQPVEPPDPATLRANSTTVTGKRPTVQRKRGSLKSMLKMPLDILIEIMAYLTPKDLLSLSRTTKDLRAFLMRRSSASFWRAAHNNDETLPPCPADLSEPAYANLLYSAHCHNCVRKNCNNIFWEARVRLCRNCHPKLRAASDFTYSSVDPKSWLFSSKDVCVRLYSNSTYCKYDFAYSPHVARLEAAMASMTSEEKETYLEIQKRRVSEIRQTVYDLRQWYESTKQSRSCQLNDIRTQRQHSILSTLVELGYQPELDHMNKMQRSAFFELPELQKKSVLSPQSWKTIESRVLSFMNDIRVSRLRCLRIDAVGDRMFQTEEIIHREFPKLHQHLVWPCELLFNIPQLRKLVEPDIGLLDQDKATSVVKAELPPYLERRMQEARTHFQKLVLEDIEVDTATDPLSLAVGTYFGCRGCSIRRQTFAEALKHACPSRELQPSQSDYHYAARGVFGRQTIWEPGWFSTVVQAAQRYVQLYGLDPRTATAEDMDSCTTRIKCLKHGTSSWQTRLTVHSWRSLLCTHSLCSDKCDLTQASEKESAASIQLEAARRKQYEEDCAKSPLWCCVWCPDRTNGSLRTKIDSYAHLQTEHEITEPKEDDLLYMTDDFLGPRDVLYPVILIPSEVKKLPKSQQYYNILLENLGATYFDFD